MAGLCENNCAYANNAKPPTTIDLVPLGGFNGSDGAGNLRVLFGNSFPSSCVGTYPLTDGRWTIDKSTATGTCSGAPGLQPNIWIQVVPSTSLNVQSNYYSKHTSCSQPIYIGEELGAPQSGEDVLRIVDSS